MHPFSIPVRICFFRPAAIIPLGKVRPIRGAYQLRPAGLHVMAAAKWISRPSRRAANRSSITEIPISEQAGDVGEDSADPPGSANKKEDRKGIADHLRTR